MTSAERLEQEIYEKTYPIIKLDEKYVNYIIKNNFYFQKMQVRKRNKMLMASRAS